MSNRSRGTPTPNHHLDCYVEIRGHLKGPPLIPGIAPKINVVATQPYFEGPDPSGSPALLKNWSRLRGPGEYPPKIHPRVSSVKVSPVNHFLVDRVFPCRPDLNQFGEICFFEARMAKKPDFGIRMILF